MRVIVAGSRGVTGEAVVLQALRDAYLILGINPTTVVSGAARGVDSLGEAIARKHGLKIARRPADWNRYGNAAGYRRNKEMAAEADALVAVWDGASPGTRHMIAIAQAAGLPTWVHRTDTPAGQS